ncbi:substrate-binding domain-containing protein [Shewanella sp. NIFS-20-20]|uniref:substrate-binding domain-containing protein n=1 Tax=Shewanella sp. NIFS-20-20 TaxID=2853806 RepID=UPI001C493D51|nr:substrate-binding domain-containing protein [Shewanella sp. NIFS-20-20]MBV7316648.1 substrate-binding domain-containing protein [Shewanella sp. NIFS-20-20]
MKKLAILVSGLLLTCGHASAIDCHQVLGQGERQFSLATGSPGELGLLAALAQEFGQQHNASLCWVKAGSGKSLALLKAGEIDMVMVHAPAAEQQAINEGWAVERQLLGSNQFYIVGPHHDPAGIANSRLAKEAFAKIALQKHTFITRGDNSGTHKKELSIWQQAKLVPSGDWYQASHDFMKASLQRANAGSGYFMTDSSTWVASRAELNNLTVLFKGDPYLVNTYHSLRAPSSSTDANQLAQAFSQYLVSAQGQALFAQFGQAQFGQAMYQAASASLQQ